MSAELLPRVAAGDHQAFSQLYDTYHDKIHEFIAKFTPARPQDVDDICQSLWLRVIKYAATYDASKPDGQPRRCLDTSRALERFGFRARMPFDEGLRCTVEWYRANRATSRSAFSALTPSDESPSGESRN